MYLFSQNVKLLQQFINPYTGTVYDPTRTGKPLFRILFNVIVLQILLGKITFPENSYPPRCLYETTEGAK